MGTLPYIWTIETNKSDRPIETYDVSHVSCFELLFWHCVKKELSEKAKAALTCSSRIRRPKVIESRARLVRRLKVSGGCSAAGGQWVSWERQAIESQFGSRG